MFHNLFWILAVAGFVAQLLCCVYGKNRLIQLLPMGIMALAVVGTLILGTTVGGLGFFAAFAVAWNELKILIFMTAGYGLYRLVAFTKK